MFKLRFISIASRLRAGGMCGGKNRIILEIKDSVKWKKCKKIMI